MSDETVSRRPPNFQDLTGQRFGLLVVVRWSGRDVWKRAVWESRCDCGKSVAVKAWNLKNGHQQSCGCDKKRRIGNANATHGHTRGDKPSKAYTAWLGIRRRCLNKNSQDYPDYGGRGITVCARWLDSFEDFLADVGEPPTAGHSIDRYPDNDGNYEPGNVRWATLSQQAVNKRNNRLLTLDGVALTVADWGRRTGFGLKRIHARLKRGWPVEKALTTPLRGK